jgi:hypothetical protein
MAEAEPGPDGGVPGQVLGASDGEARAASADFGNGRWNNEEKDEDLIMCTPVIQEQDEECVI